MTQVTYICCLPCRVGDRLVDGEAFSLPVLASYLHRHQGVGHELSMLPSEAARALTGPSRRVVSPALSANLVFGV